MKSVGGKGSKKSASFLSTHLLLVQTLAAAAVTVVVVFASFVFVIDRQQEAAAQARIENKVEDFGSMTAWAVGNWLKGRIDETVDAAGFYKDTRFADDPYVVLESEALARQFVYRFIGTPDGEFKVWPHVALSDEFDPRERPWYRAAVDRQGVALIAPYLAPVGELTLSVAVPVYEEGELQAVIGTDFLVGEIANLLSTSDLGGLGYLFLVDGNGTIISHPDGSALFRSVSELADQDVSLGTEIQTVFERGQPRMMSFRPIKGLPGAQWYVGMSIDRRAAFESVWTFRRNAAIATVLAVAMMIVAMGVVVQKLLAEPLVRARKQSEAASVAKSEFLANMSHEIRTPMNGVLGMAEILGGTALDRRQAEFVSTIERSGTALLSIINDILDFSKFESGKMDFEERPFDLQAMLDDVASLAAAGARDKNLELMVRYAPELPTHVVGDMGRIRQIMTNLCGNAIKFTTEGYVLLEVTGSVQDGQLAFNIGVTDTGIGVRPEEATKIFEQFTQAESSTTRRFGGTGLGLTISRRLAKAMGGDITLESEYGVGSTFTVHLELPVADNQQKRPAMLDGAVSGLNALIVDDVPVNRQIVAEQLRGWGARSVAVASASAAQQFLGAENAGRPHLDLILLDYQMPEMDGLELAEWIKAQPELSSIPVIVMSSVEQAGTAASFSAAGVASYLTKPVRAATLQQTILEVISDRQLQDVIDAVTAAGDGSTDDAAPDFDVDNFDDAPSQQVRILVAEDNEINRMVISTMLDDLGCVTTYAENGAEAVAHFEAAEFDAIFMDISMPVMDGEAATDAIRMLEKQMDRPATPIIALTAHAMTGDRERFLAGGMTDYLSKPIRKEHLANCIERWHGGADKVAKRA